MANPLIRDKLSSRIETAIREAGDASGVDHAGMKGKIREIAIKNLFKPLLTSQVGIGSGKIVDHRGFQSKETDVIIYGKDIHPAILYYEKDDIGLYPVESCLYAIEVKSKATATELKDAMEKARTLRELQYASGRWDQEGRSIQHNITQVIPTFFAFGSDLTGGEYDEIERYTKFDENGDFDPLIRAICIVGKGYWYYRNERTASGNSRCKWLYFEANEKRDEVMSFLGGTLNSIQDSIASRGNPRFGQYIIPNESTLVRDTVWRFNKRTNQWIKRK